ncbi:MAG: LPS assembly protein LptD, partial [Acidobacteriota bacterium]|nr:LPS assembly protein LptD [Acidobacteriota bacterium]
MRPRTLVFITMLALCHLQVGGQALTNALPPAAHKPAAETASATQNFHIQVSAPSSLPDDPGQEILPLAQPEPAPETGVPVQIAADEQTLVGNVWTLSGNVTIHYRNYVVRADKMIYNRATTELKADGHLQVTDRSQDVVINASHGEMRLNMHTARFYNVSGSRGVGAIGRTTVYFTTNPFLFSGRVVIETGEGEYRIIDGSMTNCRLPRPDWRVIAHSIDLADGKASTSNSFFEFLGVPIFYFPYLSHPVDTSGRESGLLIPVLSNSSIRGFIVGEQAYWAINRSMDMTIGTEYYSKRGWAPNGDFRFKGRGLDHLIVRWDALFDRGVEQTVGGTTAAPGQAAVPASVERVDQGGTDIAAYGRKDFSADTRVAGNVEYLSSYIYRLVFNDIFSQAVSSQVSSDVALIHNHNGIVPSVSFDRFQNFASSTRGDEAKILHLPNLRYDILDRPLIGSPIHWGLATSLGYMGRSEPLFHARNVGRIDIYPHLSLPFVAGGWSVVPQFALRDTLYSISQTPDLTGARNGIPTISHDPLNRSYAEASVDIRPPALERDFTLTRWNRRMRHVI